VVPLTDGTTALRALVLALLVLVASPAVAEEAAAVPRLPTIHPASVAVRLETMLDDLALPVSAVPVGDDAGRLLVTQLAGVVVVVEEGVVRGEPFLDLRHRVTGLEGEQGLFTVALEDAARARERGHPPHLVAAFTEIGTGDLVVAAYPIIGAMQAADPAAEVELLRVPMPEPFHHGGQVAFAADGTLFVSVGDGQASNRFLHEHPASAQRFDTLRGKLLRIDPFPVAADPLDRAYAVPVDNPFVGVSAGRFGERVRDEIWAFGFRNPWKFTFDEASGAIYLSNVGQDRWESIYRVVRGGDHGWPAREGPECQTLPDVDVLVDPTCPTSSYVEPVVFYAHLALDPAGGQAVVGGLIVRDPELPGLHGRYLFGDFVSGRLWSWDRAEDRIELLLDTDLAITGIDAGPRGEVLVIGVQGVLARLVAAPD
jgi:glucose/arabinose dehydrogenase